MGKRGPKKAPSNVRQLRGDRVAPEPVPSERDVEPPEWLSDAARAVWEGLAGDLEARGVLTHWDAEALGCYCDAVVRRRRASAALDVEGEVVDAPVFDRNGKLTGTRRVKSVWTQVWRDADAQVARWGARFGLTPAERRDLPPPQPRSDGLGVERLLT